MMTEQKKGISIKDMCEHIVKAGFLRFHGKAPTAEQIWNYSPTGELYMILEWYEMACILLQKAADGDMTHTKEWIAEKSKPYFEEMDRIFGAKFKEECAKWLPPST
jgi:hypothetical protein